MDSGASSDKTGSCTTCGATISVASFATAQSPDTVLVLVASSKTTASIQTAPSGTGLSCDAAVRNELLNSAGASTSEWVCHASATVSSETVTCNIVGSPSSAICEVIAVNGAEDPTSTFNPFDKATGTSGFVCTGQRAAGGGTAAPSTATGPSASCTSGAVTSLNANDFWIGIEAETDTTAQTGGNLGAVAATFIHTTTVSTTLGLSLERRASSATTSAAVCGTFATAESRWNIVCDVLQAKPTYFKVEPQTSASLTGTPSTTVFSGTGWVVDTSGITSLLNDIQAGTWQIDMKAAVGSTTGTPVARYFVTAWKCTTDTCTSPTLLWTNWDIATNIASSTTQTSHSYTTASQASFASWTGNFLALEVWVAWQYSGSTASTTMTFTTIDTSMDFILPGIDYVKTNTASITLSSAVQGVWTTLHDVCTLKTPGTSSCVSSLSGSVTLAFSEVGTWTSTRLTCTLKTAGSSTCSSTLTGTITLATALVKAANHIYSLVGSLNLSTALSQVFKYARALAGAITLTNALAVTMTSSNGSLSCTLNSPIGAKECSTTRTGSVGITTSTAEKFSYLRSLSGSVILNTALTKIAAHFYSLFQSISINTAVGAVYTPNGPTFSETLTASITSSSTLTKSSQFFRGVSGSLTFSSVFSHLSQFSRSLMSSLTFSSNPSEAFQYHKTFAASLTFSSDTNRIHGIIVLLSGNLSFNTVLSRVLQYYRTFSASVTVNAVMSQMHSGIQHYTESLSALLTHSSVLNQAVTSGTSVSPVPVRLLVYVLQMQWDGSSQGVYGIRVSALSDSTGLNHFQTTDLFGRVYFDLLDLVTYYVSIPGGSINVYVSGNTVAYIRLPFLSSATVNVLVSDGIVIFAVVAVASVFLSFRGKKKHAHGVNGGKRRRLAVVRLF